MGGKIHRYSPVSRKTHNLHNLKISCTFAGDIKQMPYSMPRIKSILKVELVSSIFHLEYKILNFINIHISQKWELLWL